MKKKILTAIFLLIFSISISFGQVLKLRSTSVAIYYANTNSWSDWEEESVLITIDLYKERITIYSSEKQVYDIAEYKGKNDNDEISSLYCIDKNG